MTQQAGALKRQVGSGELRTVLESALACHPGVCQRIAELERRSTLYCTSSTIEELSAHLADGTTLELIFKNLSREALLETARRVKPAFLYDPLREIETYRTVLARSALGTAICYGTVVDHDIDRYWLFLERVPGLELYQVGDLDTWQQVARWLASMHTCFVGKTESLARSAPLLRYDSDFYRLWMGRAQTFLGQAESSQPKSVRHRIKRLAKRYDHVVEHLLALGVKHLRVVGSRATSQCGDDDCPHVEAGVLWSAAQDILGASAKQLTFLRAHGQRRHASTLSSARTAEMRA